MDKQLLLSHVRSALAAGTISPEEIRALLPATSADKTAEPISNKPADAGHKLSAVEVMFYIAGLILFSSIMSIIVQSWEDGNALVHILLSAGIGAGLWALAYNLHKPLLISDIRSGLINALILTGSLSIIVGGFITTNELIGGFEEVNFLPGAATFAVLGLVHLLYDRKIRKDLLLLMGTVLAVATFPALMFGILENADVPMDVWSGVFIVSAGLLAYASRVIAKVYPGRGEIRQAFDSLAAFLALGAMFVSSFTEYGIFWLAVLIAAIFGLFYLSITAQNKHLLGNASFFLVVTVLTISFRYFSGFGVTASLIIATLGLLGSAAIATTINKKYFGKQPTAK